MATYNGSAYLREQLDSILHQTLLPKEIIIQDDCSTDDTVLIIQEYLCHLPIQFEINPVNLGYVRNFELALSKATGDYIALCDQDDIWAPNKLKLLLSNIGGKSLVYSNSLLINSKSESLNTTLSQKLRNHFISTHSPLTFIYDNCVSAHAMLFHHSLIPYTTPFPSQLYFDAWIAANAAALNGISYIDQTLVHYRQHTNNTLGKTTKTKLSLFKKISLKVEKKASEHDSHAKIISEFLSISSLTNDEQNLLKSLQIAHLAFAHHWFNFTLFTLLILHRKTLFAITTRNPFSIALKKSIGLKLYRLFPFL